MPWVSLVIEWVRQKGTDRLIQLKRSQDPRIEISEKLKAEELSLQDALEAIRPNSIIVLNRAVAEIGNVITEFCKHATPALKGKDRDDLNRSVEKLKEDFQKFLGTPLDTPEMKE